MSIKASDLFVSCLLAEGVTTVFGVPGEENLDLLESLRNSPIKIIITRNEQTAVFMAATYGRLTGNPGVALATLGPGATNMMTGAAFAQLGGMPVILITGQKPVKKSKQGRFQIIDVVSMMTPLTKSASSIADIHRIPAAIRQAFKLAQEEKPGAVHIELPEDIARETTDEHLQPITPHTIRRPQIDTKMLGQLVDKITSAKQPIILIGAGANRKRISNYLTKFIEKTNIPFFSSQMGKGVVSEILPQYIGTAALTSGDYCHELIEQSDCIIAVGYDIVEKPTAILHQEHIDLIHINFTSANIDQLYAPTLEVVGDIGNTFRQLYEHEDIQKHTWNFEHIYKQIRQNKEKIIQTTHEEYDQLVLGPRRLAKELREILKPTDILTLDNGLYKVRLARNYPAIEANTILLDNALATMGAGLSSAMVAKLLYPEREVICVIGDGGLLMNLGDLETAVRLGVNITIIILNDHAYGMIKRKQKHMGLQDFGLDLTNPDFQQLAHAFGANSLQVQKAEDFTQIMQQSLNQKGVTLVEVLFSYPDEIT